MKVQRRELNVFSMSALDLFASGMGAFVLLAIVAMPFFPNTGDSQQRVEDLNGEIEGLKGEIISTQSRSEELQSQVETLVEVITEQSELIIPHLDIVICLDITGSMTNQIDGMKSEISSLADVLDRLSPSVGIGIIAFGDKRYQSPIHEIDIVETTNMSRIQGFVNELTPGMNDPRADRNVDPPEAVTTALEHAIEMSWRPESEKRYIIVITDNASYPDREDDAMVAARNFSSQDNHHVSTVRANPNFREEERLAALRFLQELSEAGQGNYVDAAGGESILSSILLAILE